MKHLLTAALAVALVVFAPAICTADNPVSVGHSTVHVVFIAPHSQEMFGGMKGMGMGGRQTPMARVGDIIVPADGIRPIRITIDGDFVGHALVGMSNVKPVFVLPKGHHKLTFAIDGVEPIPAEITALGGGSKQYLIVKLPTEKPQPEATDASVDATIKPSGE